MYQELSDYALTPSHLIIGRCLNDVSISNDNSIIDLKSETAGKRYKYMS